MFSSLKWYTYIVISSQQLPLFIIFLLLSSWSSKNYKYQIKIPLINADKFVNTKRKMYNIKLSFSDIH